MKQEDFERLKAVCEKEGFEMSIKTIDDYQSDYIINVKKKKPFVKVELDYIDDRKIVFRYSGNINLVKKMPDIASQLEKYLNGEATD